MKTDLLTTDEVAAELRISAEAARKLMTRGLLPYVTVTVGQQRQTRRVRRATLDAYLEREQRGGSVKVELQRVRETRAALAAVEERW